MTSARGLVNDMTLLARDPFLDRMRELLRSSATVGHRGRVGWARVTAMEKLDVFGAAGAGGAWRPRVWLQQNSSESTGVLRLAGGVSDAECFQRACASVRGGLTEKNVVPPFRTSRTLSAQVLVGAC